MPQLSQHQSASTTKLLLIGDSGSGKTGALASLASAGYNLRVLDLDNGLDVLHNLLSDPRSPYAKDSLQRVRFVTLTEPMKVVGKTLVPTRVEVWQKCMNMLYHWQEAATANSPAVDLGTLTSWTPQDIVVIDSLSTFSTAAMNFVLSLNGRVGKAPFQSDYGQAQNLVESALQMLFDSTIQCNVIVTAHIAFIGEDNGPLRGYPASLGKALPPKVGRYFNTMLGVKSTGQGTAVKRKIHTNTQGVIDLKNTAPLRVPPDFPLETGLADYFKLVRQASPGAVLSPVALSPKAPTTPGEMPIQLLEQPQ
jgi:hypothetical protein